jgi:hypothetical protein
MDQNMSHESGDRKRDILLMSLEELGGSANTSQIREISGIKSNVMGHHMRVLAGENSPREGEEPLVDRDGKEQLDNAPRAANIYRLTEAGRARAEKLTMERDGFVGLTDEALRVELSRLRADYEELREDQERFRERHNKLLERLTEQGLLD